MTDAAPHASAVEAQLDPAASHFIALFGRKGTGKSVLAHRLFATYPYDRCVIDFHGDTGPEGPKAVPDARTLSDPLPTHFPAQLGEGQRTTLRYVPDPSSPTYVEDLDRVVGLCFFHRRTCLWIDEIGELTSASSTQPHLRRALHQGRHRLLTLIMAGPRPVFVDPLVLAQADYVYVTDLPNPRDRDRVADSIGWSPKDFSAAMNELIRPDATGKRQQHRYLRYDARAGELVEFPPLPLRVPTPAGGHPDSSSAGGPPGSDPV